ncbi:hypothetical protein PGT21_003457 [Puccinia graminis f. sp. tritici]|uniref:Uncharacterized protein n=1 Tax=Puccinia graminis f. sp. tritici TaxID=56615 RepID=A0A5B0Q226_PUCGR|nr:hypothetical protein PGT21_003457 [Puccinia graminis f. sp. tritici]
MEPDASGRSESRFNFKELAGPGVPCRPQRLRDPQTYYMHGADCPYCLSGETLARKRHTSK